VPACVDDLFRSSELVAKVSWGDEPVAAVGESMEAINAVRNRADLALLLAVRSYECRGEHRAEGHASVVSWLQHHLHLTKRVAQRTARLARFVSRFPDLEAGMAAGHLSLDHVGAIADHFSEKHAAAWEEAMPHVVEHAQHMRFEDVVRDLRAFANDLAPKKAEDDLEELIEGRKFSKTAGADFDGHGRIQGWLDPISYPIFASEHDRLTDQLFLEDWAFCQDVLGRDPDEVELADLTRTRRQRAHDALIEMARRSKADAGGRVAAGAEVVLHTTVEAYQEALRHKLADDPHDRMVIPPRGFCETEDGTPLSPMAAVYVSLWGQVRRIVFGADDEILSYGKAKDLFTPVQRGAVLAKFRRCTHLFGCDITGRRLQIDHVLERHQGGPTDVVNAQPLDSGHNRWKHRNPEPPDGPRDHGQRRGPPAWS
jgi:hypothetical protein